MYSLLWLNKNKQTSLIHYRETTRGMSGCHIKCQVSESSFCLKKGGVQKVSILHMRTTVREQKMVKVIRTEDACGPERTQDGGMEGFWGLEGGRN